LCLDVIEADGGFKLGDVQRMEVREVSDEQGTGKVVRVAWSFCERDD
jgi:hypothetical protein